jgi:hypothetical protein
VVVEALHCLALLTPSFKLNLILEMKEIISLQRVDVHLDSPNLSNQRRLQAKPLFGCENPEGCLKHVRDTITPYQNYCAQIS